MTNCKYCGSTEGYRYLTPAEKWHCYKCSANDRPDPCPKGYACSDPLTRIDCRCAVEGAAQSANEFKCPQPLNSSYKPTPA